MLCTNVINENMTTTPVHRTLMPEFGLPNHNDNVLEEQIEWNSISNRECRHSCSILKARLMNFRFIFLTNVYSLRFSLNKFYALLA